MRVVFGWRRVPPVLAVALGLLALGANGNLDPVGAAWNVVTVPAFASLLGWVVLRVPRYRLYAIDRIISRVISYAVIMAVLAGVFAGLVLPAPAILPVRAR